MELSFSYLIAQFVSLWGENVYFVIFRAINVLDDEMWCYSWYVLWHLELVNVEFGGLLGDGAE